jgi:hypothetical protein
MRRSEALQGVRVIKFTSILSRCEAAVLNQIDAMPPAERSALMPMTDTRA